LLRKIHHGFSQRASPAAGLTNAIQDLCQHGAIKKSFSDQLDMDFAMH
jgi:hypothetical protein